MNALVVRSGFGCSSFWLLGELEATSLVRGSCEVTRPPEEKTLARMAGSAFAIDSSISSFPTLVTRLPPFGSESTYSHCPGGQ